MTTSNPNGPEPVVGPDNEQLDREVNEALGGQSVEELMRDPAALAGAAGSAAEAAGAAAAAAGEHDDPAAAHIGMDLVRGRIGAVRGDDVFVELTGFGKNQGIVPLTQFDRPPRLGSIMDFVVQRLDEAEGLVILSREGAVTKATWEQLTRGAAVEARVMGHNKGGLELEMVGGIRAFMPASQVDLHHVADLEALHGQKLQALVQEIDRRSRKVVLSRRAFLEAERHARQAKLWQELHIGDTREGKVTSLAEYGAFVDIGGVDGLIHVSDLSYSRVDRPSDMLKVGDQIRVKILKLDTEKKRIGLGLKQVAPDPWDSVESQFRAGDQVSGRVTRVADFGAFVELLAGVEGLLPISEMSWKRINKPSDLVKEGDVLRVKLLALDVAKRRMTLSLKQASGDPWVGATVKYARHAVVEGTVLSTPEFGAFVELEAGIEGLVHISELADRRVNAVTDVVKPGDKVQCRVLEVDEDNRRIRLSIKQVREPTPLPPAEAPAAGATPGKPAAAKPKPRKLSGPGAGGLGHSAALGMGLGQLKL